MEINDLKRRALALRESVVEVGPADAPRRITLRRPTRFEARLAAVRCGVADGTAGANVRMERELVAAAVVAWAGVTVADVLPAGGAEPLTHHPDAVALLLDAQPDWADAMTAALFAAMLAEEKAAEEPAKN